MLNEVKTHLFEKENALDSLATHIFVYEEASVMYWSMKIRLDALGVFNHKRWNEMVCIHFILPNMSETGQACTVRTHFQTPLLRMRSEIANFREGGGTIRLKVYLPNKNYSNKFLHLQNVGVKHNSRIDWDALAGLAMTATTEDSNRQRQYMDFETTASQCTSRVGSTVGVSKPRIKPRTKHPSIVQAMLALCSYTNTAKYR
jgi:hypothetical protein